MGGKAQGGKAIGNGGVVEGEERQLLELESLIPAAVVPRLGGKAHGGNDRGRE